MMYGQSRPVFIHTNEGLNFPNVKIMDFSILSILKAIKKYHSIDNLK